MAKKRSPHDPLGTHPFGELKALKDKLEAEEAARKTAEEARKAAASARGELESRPRPRTGTPGAPTKTAPHGAKSGASDVWRPDMDKRLFEVAMAGVKPLAGAPSRVSARDPSGPDRRKTSIEARLRRAQAEGGPGLQVTWYPDGTVSAVRAGHTFALEALGRFATPQENCDLHGLDSTEAATRVSEFVRTRRARGLRCVCIIHGRGRNAPDGESVLRQAVVEALRKPPACNDIDAFATAPEACGGIGALLVSLRP